MNDSPPRADFDLDALLREQRRRFEKGAPIQVETLLDQHAGLRQQKEALLDLINHEIVLRSEFTTPPDQAEYLGRFPELATDLKLLFEVQSSIEAESAGTSRTATDAPYPVALKPNSERTAPGPPAPEPRPVKDRSLPALAGGRSFPDG